MHPESYFGAGLGTTQRSGTLAAGNECLFDCAERPSRAEGFSHNGNKHEPELVGGKRWRELRRSDLHGF
jgi:hypothetical protein